MNSSQSSSTIYIDTGKAIQTTGDSERERIENYSAGEDMTNLEKNQLDWTDINKRSGANPQLVIVRVCWRAYVVENEEQHREKNCLAKKRGGRIEEIWRIPFCRTT